MRFSLAVFSLLLFAASDAFSQSKVVTIPSDGRERTIRLTAEDKGIKELILVASAPGNESIKYNLNLTSDINVPVKLKYAQVPSKKTKIADLALKKKLWHPLSFRDGSKDKSKFSSNESAPSPKEKEKSSDKDPNCGCFTDAEIQLYLSWGLGTTKEEFCESVRNAAPGGGPLDCDGGSSGGDNPGLIGGVSGRVGILHKDACVKKDYAVQANINLKSVDASYFDTGFEFKVSIEFIEYTDDKAASLKPKSDGMFAPRPLFLMSSIGYPIAFFGDREQVHVLEMKKGKINSKKKLDIGNVVGYRGQFLRREPAFFTGRCATVEMIHEDSSTVYSHGFTLVPRRQNKGGYDGPSS